MYLTQIKCCLLIPTQLTALPFRYYAQGPEKATAQDKSIKAFFSSFSQVVKTPCSRRLTAHRFLQIGYFYSACYNFFGTIVDQVLF